MQLLFYQENYLSANLAKENTAYRLSCHIVATI